MDLADALAAQLWHVGIRDFHREHRAVPKRRFRIDIAFPVKRLAVECQGGIWVGGRHVHPTGYSAECEKFCLLAARGWRVMPVTAEHIRSGQALQWIEAALAA